MLRDTDKRMGPHLGQKLQIYPTSLTYSTVVMGWKGLWVMNWRRVVECVGLWGVKI